MSALEKYIQKLQDPVPEFRDPEDIDDETAARLAPRAAESEVSGQQPSALRRRAAAADWFEGGQKTSRKELYEEDEADLDIEDEEDDDEEEVGDSENEGGEEMEEEEEEEIDSEIEEEKEVGGGEEEEESEIEEEEKDGEMFEEEEEEEEEEEREGEAEAEESESEIEEDEEGGMFDEENDAEKSDDVEDQDETREDGGGAGGEDVACKAKAVVQQLDLWDRLMEARIQLQKVLSLSNRLLPSQDTQTEQLATARESLEDMGMKLNSVVVGDGDSPDETSRKRKADMDIEELARQSHESLATERNKVMTFWAQKTQLVTKKFKNFNKYQTPVVKQVEQILSDRDRLIRRTQVIRDDSADLSDKPEEVFDDGDFYQRLLKNLIDSKATELSKASSSASQWLEVQRMRGKKKKNKDIDTRASKGRKLRYNVHSKLVNFMFPRDTSTWSEDAKNDLFKNLFKMPSQAEI